jgi:hypothetical protein
MSRHLTHRVAALERRAVPPAPLAPCFILAENRAAADCEVERLLAEHPNAPGALFVMTRGRDPGEPAQGSG